SGSGAANPGEGGYVGYEMWLRALESDVAGIVGASGCFYAARAPLHREAVPEALSRDFAAALIARERGYRAVSVADAVCFVPRTASLVQEYRRKVRTMVRGMGTLRYKRRLLNPFRYGLFAWMLWSHKVCRWLVPWALLAALGVLAAAAATSPAARWVGAAFGAGAAAAALAGWWAARGGRRRWCSSSLLRWPATSPRCTPASRPCAANSRPCGNRPGANRRGKRRRSAKPRRAL